MMRRSALLTLAGCLVVSAMVCEVRAQSPDKVQLQLKWVTQAQFAGYYAAKAKGLYADEKLDVTIRPGGPDIVPEQVVAGGRRASGRAVALRAASAGGRPSCRRVTRARRS